MNNNMNKLVKYDLYKHRNGLLYRVNLDSPLYFSAEVAVPNTNRWSVSYRKIGGIISSSLSTLVARNVVFKDSVCSQ